MIGVGGGVDRVVAPALSLGAFAMAALVDSSSWWRTTLLAAATVAVSLTAVGLSLAVVTPVTVAVVTVAVWDGNLEPGLFLLSVLALLVTVSELPARWKVAACLLLLAVPVVLDVVRPSDLAVSPIWLLGIGFPMALGATLRREIAVAAELADARLALAESAVAEERRRIARDVHDLVGHGLAAALVQIASARHVLRRDPDAADEALAAAERAGRGSMRELRSTLAVLRDGDDHGAASLPRAGDVGALVDQARVDGLRASMCLTGEPSRVDPAVGLTVYRIAQEALANAARHAPHAETLVTLDTTSGRARLTVLSRGAVYSPPGHPTFGLRGMTERAAAVGGRVSAGITPAGWLVDAILPLERHP